MRLTAVTTKKDSAKFISFPVSLYKNEKAYIRPLDVEIENIFNPETNKKFEQGDCMRWILESDNKVIGRIAAFSSQETSGDDKQTITGGVGFFECIHNQKAANMLFDTAREWLTAKKVDYMDGPINFGNRDKWWGLLTKGFNLEPNYQCNYNFSYYQELFENYGFKNYFEQYTFTKPIQEPLHPRLKYKADLVKKDSGYSVEHFSLSKFEEHTRAIIDVYNRAWVNHEGVSSITFEEGRALIQELKPIIDEKVIWLVFYHGEPVAFYVNIPEVNQLLKHVNGKMDALGKLKFLWNKWMGNNRKLLGMVFGIVPEHQGKGVDGAMIMAFADTVRKSPKKYETIEINGIGDFNKKMILVIKQVGGQVCKIHTTYRYLFDRSQPFERMKPI